MRMVGMNLASRHWPVGRLPRGPGDPGDEGSLMGDSQRIEGDRGADGLTTVTFSRPPANALNSDVIDDVQRLGDELIADPPRVVVLRSSAPMFMAGGDL